MWRYAPGLAVGPKKAYDIGWAEAVAVKLALQLALHLRLISGAMHAGASFLVCSDNQGVVAVVNKGLSHSKNTNQVLKHVRWPLLTSY